MLLPLCQGLRWFPLQAWGSLIRLMRVVRFLGFCCCCWGFLFSFWSLKQQCSFPRLGGLLPLQINGLDCLQVVCCHDNLLLEVTVRLRRRKELYFMKPLLLSLSFWSFWKSQISKRVKQSNSVWFYAWKIPKQGRRNSLLLGPGQQWFVWSFLKKKRSPSIGLGMRNSQSEMLVMGSVCDCLCSLAAQSLLKLPFCHL